MYIVQTKTNQKIFSETKIFIFLRLQQVRYYSSDLLFCPKVRFYQHLADWRCISKPFWHEGSVAGSWCNRDRTNLWARDHRISHYILDDKSSNQQSFDIQLQIRRRESDSLKGLTKQHHLDQIRLDNLRKAIA